MEPAFRQPSWCWRMLPVVGKAMSPVVVPTTMRSTSPGSTPARSSACWAALSPRSDAASLSSTTCRSRIPVRWTIHSSEVATIFSRSWLVRIRFGAYAPMPTILARIIRGLPLGRQHLGEALRDLQAHVAGDPVGDHHVQAAVVDVPTLDVADEIEGRAPELLEGLSRQLIALALFLAHRQEPHPRVVLADDVPGVNVPHDRELEEVTGLGIDVGPRVDQDRVAREARQSGRAGRAGHAGPHPPPAHAAGHSRPPGSPPP